MEEGRGSLKDKVPTLIVLNKKDLIKPGEMAKKLEVRACCYLLFCCMDILDFLREPFISLFSVYVFMYGYRNAPCYMCI